MKEDRWKSRETVTLTKRRAGYAVAARASKKAPQSIAVNDFEPSKVLSTHRPCLELSEQGLVNVVLGVERNLSFGH